MIHTYLKDVVTVVTSSDSFDSYGSRAAGTESTAKARFEYRARMIRDMGGAR